MDHKHRAGLFTNSVNQFPVGQVAWTSHRRHQVLSLRGEASENGDASNAVIVMDGYITKWQLLHATRLPGGSNVFWLTGCLSQRLQNNVAIPSTHIENHQE